MALRRAVPKTPPKSPVSPRSPIYKPRFLPNPPESTLPQLLIPFHFNSCIRNVYKKPQGEAPRVHPKVWQLATSHSGLLWPPHERPQPQSPLCVTHNSLYTSGWRALPVGQPNSSPSRGFSRDESWLSLFGVSRVRDHATDPWTTAMSQQGPVPWSPGTVAPQSAKCQNHGCYCFAPLRETY